MKHHSSRQINSLIALGMGLLLLALPLQAEVVARLSSPVTSLQQPVQLTLESRGEQEASPDLSVLDRDFEILGRASQQSVSIINGSVSAKRSLILTLLPKREGELTIPPIPFGDRQTDPLKLEVKPPSDDPQAATSREAWVELSLNKTEAYPEEEVILSLKLYQAAGVRGESLDQPQPSLGDTRLQLLDESNYTTEIDGTAYRVLERSYGLYAYQSGRLEIAPVLFRGRTGGASVFSLLDDPFAGLPLSSRLIHAQSEPVALQIKAIPEQFSGDHWLPARNLQLVATGIDSAQPLIAGKPLTRRIMLIADGLMSSQLPAISTPAPAGIKPYEERPQLRDTPRRTGISGSRESVVTLIPTRAGSFTLPAIEIPWWNTQTGKQELARLPAVTLKVLPGTGDNLSEPLSAARPQGAENAPAETRNEAASPAPTEAEENGIHWLVWVLAAAWLATLVGWWLSHRRSSASEVPLEPPARPASDNAPLAAAVAALNDAYREGDATAAREAWLQWAQRRWPERAPHNLSRLAARCPPGVAQAVIALEKALYSPAQASDWVALFDPALLEEGPQQPSSSRPLDEQLLPLNP
jgi:hypothetical protein